MATPLSSTTARPTLRSLLQPNPNPSKALLFLSIPSISSVRLASNCVGKVTCQAKALFHGAHLYGSAANYAASLPKHSYGGKRQTNGILAVRCATIEEIEAEKSLIEKDTKARMEKTIETVRSNFNSVRTGRANPAMLDKIEVEYYGSPITLKSIAQISTPDASSLLVQPYDKSSLKAIEKAIVSSDVGLTPNNDGEVIRLSIPQLTSDRRKELSKVVAKLAEEGKVALRNIRRDALKAYEKLEKEKKLSEDNVKDLSSDLQKLTDGYMKKIDTAYKQKEQELLKV